MERDDFCFPHDTDTRPGWREGNGWKTERPYMKDRVKDNKRDTEGPLCHNTAGPCMYSDHVGKNKVLETSATEVRGSGEVHERFSFRKKATDWTVPFLGDDV